MATIPGTTGPDRLVGTDESDQMSALAGDDTLEGGRGDDKMNGDDGLDTYFINPGDGQDSVFLGEGDSLVFNGFTNIDSFDDLDGHIAINKRFSIIDVSGAEGVIGGTQSVRVTGSRPSDDNVDFNFTITPLPGAFVVGEEPPSEFTSLRPASSDWMFD